MLKSLNVKKAHLFVLYMAGGLFLWHRNDYLNDIGSGARPSNIPPYKGLQYLSWHSNFISSLHLWRQNKAGKYWRRYQARIRWGSKTGRTLPMDQTRRWSRELSWKAPRLCNIPLYKGKSRKGPFCSKYVSHSYIRKLCKGAESRLSYQVSNIGGKSPHRLRPVSYTHLTLPTNCT